ncbi:MAG: chalcone isomerase family protein [Proteobacteria bacterium]|jgi:hypothetical protein|nr:chalcone isomerase family protein [Pseudomonadota bacterium]MCG6934491.1 chalcone isomerase family protein [Pseudomonadota bacterium]
MKTLLTLIFACLLSSSVLARDIAGVNVANTTTLHGGTTPLILNGAGIRSKFIFDIYVGALYLPSKATTVDAVLAEAGPKRVSMHFLYDEVDKDKLTDGWREGFENNLDPARFKQLEPALNQFNGLFRTVHKGDVIELDFQPGHGTQVWFNNELQGSVTAENFYPALLLVWLGKDPADEDLKEAMLGHD